MSDTIKSLMTAYGWSTYTEVHMTPDGTTVEDHWSGSWARAEGAEKFGVENPGHFKVDDEQKASWAVARILEFDEKDIQLQKEIEAAMAPFRTRCKALEIEKGDFEREYMPELEQFTRDHLVGSSRTVKVLTGSMGLKTLPGGFKVDNAEELIKWAKANNHPELVRTKEEPVAAQVKTLATQIKTQGLGPLPGVVEVPDTEKFYVTRPDKKDSEKNLVKAVSELWNNL